MRIRQSYIKLSLKHKNQHKINTSKTRIKTTFLKNNDAGYAGSAGGVGVNETQEKDINKFIQSNDFLFVKKPLVKLNVKLVLEKFELSDIIIVF